MRRDDKKCQIVIFSDLHYAPETPENNGSMTEDIKDHGIPDGVYFIVELDGERIIVREEHIKL